LVHGAFTLAAIVASHLRTSDRTAAHLSYSLGAIGDGLDSRWRSIIADAYGTWRL